MNKGEEKQTALVLAQSSPLTITTAKSLAARGRNHLRDKEEAEEWLRKGRELQSTGPSTLSPEPQMSLEYIKQVLAGIRPNVAAKNLGMTDKDHDRAKEAHKAMPGTFAHVEQENELRKALLKRHEEIQQDTFRCFEKGHDLDSMNVELLYHMAESYYWADGVQRNNEKAASLYRQAAEQGHSGAQHGLSNCFYDGKGVKQDLAEAVTWLRKAAEQGRSSAQYDFGVAYKYGGRGVQPDAAQAAKWFHKVVNQTSRK